MRRVGWAATALLLLAWLCTCVAFVDETERAFVTRFGKIVSDQSGLEPGLVVKLPWPIDRVRRFDRRLQVYEPPALERVTKDKKSLTVSAYICWRIADTYRFFRTVGSVAVGHRRLEEQVTARLSSSIGQRDLSELVSVDPGQSQLDSMMTSLTNELQPEVLEQFGIELMDVRLKRFNHPSEVRQAIYDRIRSERNRDAVRYRSEGDSEAQMIRSRADLQRETSLAKAEATATTIRGSADAERTRILNEAHAQNPQFYDLLRTLEAYQKILDQKTTLVLSTDNPLFRLLTDAAQGSPESKPAKGVAETKPADSAGPAAAPAESEKEPGGR